jgi:CheY-like chemotaxis protein
LGLAISRSFARMAGGELTVTSVPGQGSTFHLVMPVAIGAIDEVAPIATSRNILGLAPGQGPFRILIADDHIHNRHLLTELLPAEDFLLREATNGVEAIEIFTDWHPHLILMDIAMPVIDGLDAIRRIKALPGGVQVPIIAVTSKAFVEERREIQAAGADDIITKPFKTNELMGKICVQLGASCRYGEETPPDPPASADSATPSGDAIRTLPLNLAAQLRLLVQQGYLDQFTLLLAEVKSYDERLAGELLRLADNFEYDGLLSLLQGGNGEHV